MILHDEHTWLHFHYPTSIQSYYIILSKYLTSYVTIVCRKSLGSTSCDNHLKFTAIQNTTEDQDDVSDSSRHVTSTESIEHCVMENGGVEDAFKAP